MKTSDFIREIGLEMAQVFSFVLMFRSLVKQDLYMLIYFGFLLIFIRLVMINIRLEAKSNQ